VTLLIPEIERLVLHAASDQRLLHFARDPRPSSVGQMEPELARVISAKSRQPGRLLHGRRKDSDVLGLR
jgi:hypothetical protein